MGGAAVPTPSSIVTCGADKSRAAAGDPGVRVRGGEWRRRR